MTDQELDSGYEFVLDNRKLIVAFVVAVAICGLFFVLGYSIGKHQGEIAALDAVPGTAAEQVPAPSPETADAGDGISSIEPDEVRQDLEWYQSVNKKANEPVGVEAPEPPPAAAERIPAAGKSPAVPKDDLKAASGPVSYSVQVGAFKQRVEADAHAQTVRAKGFDSRVELPTAAQALFLVKVGRFETRAEAVAEQLNLKKNGFSCFVKTN